MCDDGDERPLRKPVHSGVETVHTDCYAILHRLSFVTVPAGVELKWSLSWLDGAICEFIGRLGLEQWLGRHAATSLVPP
jgi:hypothetical protein